MKKNAIVRIALYSLMILILGSLLFAGIGSLSFHIGSGDGTVVENSASVEAAQVRQLEIDWAAGSIRIETGDTDRITFRENAQEDTKYAMTYRLDSQTLKLCYSDRVVLFGSMPAKDLVITVPEDWYCQDLEIDGAALDIAISGAQIGQLELDGASNKLELIGMLGSADIDGASNDIRLNCLDRISRVDMDGVSCKLTLTLPAECGFQAELEGLSSKFSSSLEYTKENDKYCYADRYCQISADGISCQVRVEQE